MKVSLNRLIRACVVMLSLVSCLVAHAEATDQFVVELYETYCMACHSIEGTGAPMAFDAKKWNELAEQGADQLLNNVITGVRNMPAQGGCMECGYEDFEDLIKYMSHPNPKK